MSNVVTFERAPKPAAVHEGGRTQRSMTLFIHIKQATLIAHWANMQSTTTPAQERRGKSNH